MTKLFLAALMIWGLPFSGASCGSANVRNAQTRDTEPKPTQAAVTLTNEHPTGSFSVESELLANPPEILEVSITKVVNSAMMPLDIFVYLSIVAEKGKPNPEKTLVGNFSLYPSDRPGKFLLSPSTAFRQLSETKTPSKSNELRLVVELKRLDETRAWTPVEVTIAQPKWRATEK